MSTFSYHIFMLPFQWRIRGYKDRIFSEQICLGNIEYATHSNWERTINPILDNENDSLYNEKNYFYEFVHDALYDYDESNTLIRHYERCETKRGGVTYMIDCGNHHNYELKVDAINLNLFSTGVGVLSFYLSNDKYHKLEDVLRINQKGRRIFPPNIASVQHPRSLIADCIEIKGLHGSEKGYREDFCNYTNKTKSNKFPEFIPNLVHEIATNIELSPVVDDRMFVLCWYKNDEMANAFKGKGYESFLKSSDWYEFVFVDEKGEISCQNEELQAELIKKATYARWQKWSSLYGISRYSMVYLTNNGAPLHLFNTFETIYARMAELILVQKASVLRFSAEVTNISNMNLKKDFSKKASSLYKEYIRFVNQIHFREISAQDQGIELYQKLYETMNLKEHVEKLDDEIEELYNYVSLSEDRKNNKTLWLLTWIATIAVPITMMSGIFGMNNKLFGDKDVLVNDAWFQIGTSILFMLVIIGIINLIKNRKK